MSGCSEECAGISVDIEDKVEKGVVTPATTICWPALLPGSAGPSGGVFLMMLMSNPEPAESTAVGNSSQHSRSGNSLAPIIWQQSDAMTSVAIIRRVTIVDVESKRSILGLRLISLLQMNKSVIIVSLYSSHFD